MGIEQWGFIRVPHLLWHGASVYNHHSHPRTCDTHTYCRALSSGAITSCFYDLGVLRLGLGFMWNALFVNYIQDTCDSWLTLKNAKLKKYKKKFCRKTNKLRPLNFHTVHKPFRKKHRTVRFKTRNVPFTTCTVPFKKRAIPCKKRTGPHRESGVVARFSVRISWQLNQAEYLSVMTEVTLSRQFYRGI